MLLTVIIVNYNVKYFLEQCLFSVKEAISNWQLAIGNAQSVEVMVVDNHSADGSIAYLKPKFPFVQFIENNANIGFASANNQALTLAKGQYVLFLNPDTIVPEDIFMTCIAFMEQHPDAGALGVRMIDGSGKYLKESKRGFPTPWVAFCKMSGLTKLFPRSSLFARYYLGNLPEKEMHVADALAGAFMLVRKATLDITGGFDEQFFMYAEDIDLSYRIQQAGYRNYYYPAGTIIHFKGESTTKDARYIQLFYKAMIQFVQKHFHGPLMWLYAAMLKALIAVRTMRAPRVAAAAAPVMNALPPGDQLLVRDEKTSFKKIIDLLQQQGPAVTVMIHASGSGSMVGSQSKSRQGKVVVRDSAG